MAATYHHGGIAPGRILRRLTGSGADVVVTAPSWHLRISRWLVGLLACLLCYVPYWFFVVPLIEPPVALQP